MSIELAHVQEAIVLAHGPNKFAPVMPGAGDV
jgi:hypothetical protein